MGLKQRKQREALPFAECQMSPPPHRTVMSISAVVVRCFVCGMHMCGVRVVMYQRMKKIRTSQGDGTQLVKVSCVCVYAPTALCLFRRIVCV